MSSYHDSFTYKKKNSFTDMNLIISSFEPDEGFTETFLSMDPVYEDNFDGTKQYSYGAKYNSKANIAITLVKKDYSDWFFCCRGNYRCRICNGKRNNALFSFKRNIFSFCFS